ncbi:DBF4-type zinc finger-containing protein 2 isoform X2 [Tenrec ecaudatus]
MERFLQDVLRHHPYQDQENRSTCNESQPKNTVSPEVAQIDHFISEEIVRDTSGVRGNIFIKGLEPFEELWSRPIKSQECTRNVSVRPSVIQKLEKGKQHPLEFVPKIGDSLKGFNPVDVGQAPNNGQNLMCPSVISSAPASCLTEPPSDKPALSHTMKSPPVAHLDSVSKCDPNPEKLGKSSSNPIRPSHLEISSVSDQKPKESNKKSFIKPGKLILQKDVKSQGKSVSTDSTFERFMDTKRSLELDSLSKLAVYSATKWNKINMPSNKGIFEDAHPKNYDDLFLNTNPAPQPDNNVFFSKSAFLDQKFSLCSQMKFSCKCFQSVSDRPQEINRDLNPLKEEQVGLGEKGRETRGSETSADCSSSLFPPTDQSKTTAKEGSFQVEANADLQCKNNKSSGISSDCDASRQLVSSQSQGTVKEIRLQKPVRINLVDQSYESSSSEISFDCDTTFQSVIDNSQQSVTEVNLPKEVYSGLVDESYGSSSSERSADSPFPSQSVADQYPVAAEEMNVQENALVDNSEASCETSLQSEVDYPQLAVKRRNLKDRHVDVIDENCRASSMKEGLAGDVSLHIMMDEPRRVVEEIQLLREKNARLVDTNYEYHDPEMSLPGDVQSMADLSQGAGEDAPLQDTDLDTDLENSSSDSSTSDLSSDSEASFYQPASYPPQGTLNEISLKKLRDDIEVSSSDSSSSDLTFDSDPLVAGAHQSQIDYEELRGHLNLQSKSCASDSSEITFDSDLSLHSVDQPQVTVYEEKSVDLESQSSESFISEITSDSDVSSSSDTDQSDEVPVKEITIHEEEHVHIERKSDEISLNSDIPIHSVTTHPYGAIKELNLQREEPIEFENKRNEPSGLELSFDYDNTICSVTGFPEASVNEVNLQRGGQTYLENKISRHVSVISLESSIPRHSVINHSNIADKRLIRHNEEHVHFENKGNESTVSGPNLKYDMPLSVITNYSTTAAKETNYQEKEHGYIENQGNELSVSKTGFTSDSPFQPVAHQPEVLVEEINLQNQKHADLEDESAEFSGSEISDLDDPHYLVTEPQVYAEKINIQKEEHIVPENKSDEGSDSEIDLDSDVCLQSLTQQLLDDRVDPEEESTKPRGYEVHLDVDAPRHSVTDQPHVVQQQTRVDLEDQSSEASYDDSMDPLQLLAEQIKKTVEKMGLQEEKDIVLENKINEPSDFGLIQDSRGSLQAEASEAEVAVEQINLEKDNHVYPKDKNSQSSGAAMSLDSEFLLHSVVDQAQITSLDQAHREVEDKHNQSCVSEISFDSDDPLQSVADQLQKAVTEISLWEDEEVQLEDKRVKPGAYEVVHDSDVIQPVAGQTAEVLKEPNLWKEHVDLEDKIIKPSDSDEPIQSVATEIQDRVNENLLREEEVCLDDKGYELSGSEVIYASHVPPQAVVGQPHILPEEHSTLEEKSDDPCSSEINSDSEGPLQLVDGQLQKAVTKKSVWKEGHIYLGDKSYKLGDFDVAFDSDTPIQFVADPSPVSDKEINFQGKNHNGLESNSYKFAAAEIHCDSGVHFQTEGDPHQVVCKEMNQKAKYLGMEEKSNELGDSEMICAAGVPLQIVVNQSQELGNEENLHKVVFLDLVTKNSDSDCEVISDSDNAFQPVIEPPEMAIRERNSINADCIALQEESCDSCDSDIRYVCEGPPQLVNNQSKEIFKFINKKGDCIILEDVSRGSCGPEIDFSATVSHQSMTHRSQGSDKNMEKYAVSEGRNYEFGDPKRDFTWEGSFQTGTDQLRKATKEVNPRKNVRASGSKKKSCTSTALAVDADACLEPVVQELVYKENPLTLKHMALSYEPCCSEMNLHCDPSLQCDKDRPTEAVNKIGLFKNITFDLKDIHDYHSSSVSMEKAKEAIEDNDEPVLEALPHVPPSFVGKTWSQIMKEDDVKINALVKEFREGRFHCYFDDDSETKQIKKHNLNQDKKTIGAALNQERASIQVLSDCDVIAGDVLDTDDFSVALDNPCLHSQVKRPYEQKWQAASQCQTVKVSHGTESSFTRYPTKKRKLISQMEDSPKKKCLLLQNDKITKNVEFPEPCTEVLNPLQPNALVYVLSSPNLKQKDVESFDFSKIRESNDTESWDNAQYKYKQSSSHYNPATKQFVIAPLDTVVPAPGSQTWANFDLSRNEPHSSAQANVAHVQSSALPSFVTVPVNYGLKSHQGTSGSSVFLENSEVLNYSAAQTSAKSVPNEFLESKSQKKTWKRKMAVNKPCSSTKTHQPVALQQNPAEASENELIWMRTKPSDIIRKYIPKYSAFLRHRYQSRSAFIGMHLEKEESDAGKLKIRRPAKETSSTVAAGTGEQVRGMASSASRHRVLASSSVERQKVNDNKNRLSSQKQPSKPVKIYALRSLSSQTPQPDRVRTRRAGKLRGKRGN